jgi:hypothetical protein
VTRAREAPQQAWPREQLTCDTYAPAVGAGEFKEMKYLTDARTSLVFDMPLAEVRAQQLGGCHMHVAAEWSRVVTSGHGVHLQSRPSVLSQFLATAVRPAVPPRSSCGHSG